ncbi:DUF3168 domain-containing protein [Rhizobium panacihumi]|uniref:DUF3168 domain-containing protein n=1 Tax=Rhizobium panacihumi TaxID=2008450 RepID=UPI003D7B7AA7
MSDPQWAVQVALVKRLESIATAAGERVYDDVPPEADRINATGAAFPYISLGTGSLVPIDEEHFDRSRLEQEINVWSRAVGFSEAKGIAGEIRLALHEQDLLIEGHVVDRMRIEDINQMRDPDGKTRRVRISLSVETQPAKPAVAPAP